MRRSRDLWGLFAAALLALALSFGLKSSCLRVGWGGQQRLEYALLCYNDLQPLYGVRHLDQGKFPYVEEKSYEYPVVIGLEMWLASKFSSDHVGFFLANVPFLSLCALLSVAGLVGAVGRRRRVLVFAAGLPLVLYAFHNWDLLAVAPLCLAMAAWAKRRDFWTGFALGIGASAKLYPGFAFPALWLARWKAGERRQAHLLLGGAVAGYSAVNLPILIACWIHDRSFQGWLGVWEFHSRRTPDFGTTWYWLADKFSHQGWLPVAALLAFSLGWLAMLFRSRDRWSVGFESFVSATGVALAGVAVLALVMGSQGVSEGPVSAGFREIADRVSFLCFALGSAALWAWQWRAGRDPWAINGAIVALFLLVSKVHSPQYALWILPFFVILSTPAALIASYFAIDLALLVTSFYWFVTSPGLAENAWQDAFAVTVFLRAGALMILIHWYAFISEELVALRE